MKMLLNNHRLIIEREQRAWSQAQLAEVTGLSLRTIQRIEKSGKASLESVKALASVYHVNISELRIVPADELNIQVNNENQLEHKNAANYQESVFLLSASTKTLSATCFILSTLVLIFLIFTGIPSIQWIDQSVETVFNSELSAAVFFTLKSSLAIASTLSVSIFIGMLFDAIRNQGLYLYIKQGLQRDKFLINLGSLDIQKRVSKYFKFILKPLVISAVLLIISGTGIYLSMEDYQKHNFSRFIQHHL